MGDEGDDVSLDSGSGSDYQTPDFGGSNPGDAAYSAPAADSPQTQGTDPNDFYTGVSAFPNTDANLPSALGAVDSIAGMQFPSNAQLGQTDTTPTDAAAIAASNNDPQAGITEAAKNAQSGDTSKGPANAPQPTSMVSKIGGGLLDLAKSAGGGAILGDILKGISAGKAQEAAIAEKHFYSAPFSSSDFSSMLNGVNTPIPMGYLERARRVGQFLNGGAQPTIGAPTTNAPAAR